MFRLKYFLSFFVNIARTCVSRMIISAVCTSNFFQAIFLRMVRVLFPAFGTCLSSSTGFSVVSIFLAFEAPQESWDVLLDFLKPIFTPLGVQGWLNVKMFVLVWIRSSPFRMEILLIFVTPFFPRADAISSSVANANSLLLITPLEVLSFSRG